MRLQHWFTIRPNHKINALIDKLPILYTNQSKEYHKDIHTTHVTNVCLRQSYFSITDPKPPSALEVGFFIVGEAQHVILQRLLGPLLKAEPEKKLLLEIKNGDYIGIVCRVDMLADFGPIEIKTNRSFKRKIKDYYLEQIKAYCVATKKRKAVLIIIWQNAPKEIVDNRLANAKRAIEAYDFIMTEREMAYEYSKIKSRFVDLTNGLRAKNPRQLRAVKHDKLLRLTVCGFCKYKKPCDQADPESERVFRQK